jgi:hypothetical protein
MDQSTELKHKSETATNKSVLTIPQAGLPGEATPTGWRAPRQQMSFDQWASVGKLFGRANTSVRWLLGDWWAFGKFDYGDKCRALAASGIDLDAHTLTNYATVCRAFSTMSRRRDILSFAHHEAVCVLSARKADELLEQAEREKLSRHTLRLLVADLNAEELADGEAMINDEPELETSPQQPLKPLPPVPRSTEQDQQILAQFHRGVGDLASVAAQHDVLFLDDFPISKLQRARNLLSEVIVKRLGR